MLVADELYAAYPILKNTLIRFEKLRSGLFGGTRGGAITLNSRKDDNEQERTLVHEVQYIIQDSRGLRQVVRHILLVLSSKPLFSMLKVDGMMLGLRSKLTRKYTACWVCVDPIMPKRSRKLTIGLQNSKR